MIICDNIPNQDRDIIQYSAALLLTALALTLKLKPINLSLISLAPIGAISYGIYIFHMPTMILIGKIPSFGGSWLEWFIRLVASIVLVLSIAYLVEIKLQPKIRLFFIGN